MPDYEKECWDLIKDQLKEIKDSVDDFRKETNDEIKTIKEDVGSINVKLASILGYAAGAGAVAGIAIAFLKDWVKKLFEKI